MPEILLSVVIPTRNRQPLALSMLRGFSKSTDQRVEVVVHDNSDDDSLGRSPVVAADRRIRYFHTYDVLNMHGNSDRAVALARGRYVTLIGDDDGIVVEEALAACEAAAAADAAAVVCRVPGYLWPGTFERVRGTSKGELFWSNPDPSPDCLLDPETELRKVFAAGMVHSLGKMPRLYQGIVSKRSLDALYEQCGTHFPGASPDMANAVALVPFVNRILATSRPAIISGHSPKSGGGAGSAGKHHGALEAQTHLPAGTVENWNPAIPRFWSGPTIYAQSAVTARHATGHGLPPIGYHRLYATCLVYEPRRYWPLVREALGHAPGTRLATAIRTALVILPLAGKRGVNFLKNALARPRADSVTLHEDMESAMAECERRLAQA